MLLSTLRRAVGLLETRGFVSRLYSSSSAAIPETAAKAEPEGEVQTPEIDDGEPVKMLPQTYSKDTLKSLKLDTYPFYVEREWWKEGKRMTFWSTWRMLRDVKRRQKTQELAPERMRLKALKSNTILPQATRDECAEQLHNLHRYSRPNLILNMCQFTGRSRGKIKPYRVNRHVFRRLADHGQLSGVQRAMCSENTRGMDIEVPDSERVRIASDFLLEAPPGEFNDVFNDVRTLLSNDELLKDGCGSAIAKHYKENFVPVQLDGGELTLITPFNELPDGRFIDPKSAKVFRYDYLKKEASDIQNASPGDIDQSLEPWRKALQTEADLYIDQHFQRSGVATVFTTSSKNVVLCIESHQFQPKNFWNGLWRSQWTLPIPDGKSGSHEIHGVVKAQVHYYEEGNVQLISNKDMTVKVTITHDLEKTARDIIHAITEQESTYQTAVQENYVSLSDTTFKSLRRQLPVTRTKLDWLKIHSYRVAQDLRPQ